jgi:OOP family OmpA-OmpF porin
VLKQAISIFTGSAIALSVVLPAVADDRGGNFYINPAIGVQDFDGDRNLDSEGLISLGLEYRYGQHWAAELNVMDSEPESESTNIDVDLLQYGIDGIYYFKEQSAQQSFEPYAVLGLGHAEFEAGSVKEQETQGRAGVGARFLLNDHWSVKADTRVLYGIDDDTVDALVMVGLSYAFNGQRKAKPAPAPVATPQDRDSDGVIDANDQCPNTPAGVAVDAKGCALDTDGDGVADFRDQCPDTPAGRKVDNKGCKFVLTRTEEVTLNVAFATNSSEVPESYFAEIKRVADFMKKYGAVKAVIEGHTDDTGKASYNESLSQRRANAVMQVLISRYNIPAARLSAKGYGEAQPIASNNSSTGRQANRRVVAVMKAEIAE